MTRIVLLTASALTFAATAFAQSAPADPWKLVPPLTTTCFNDDDFQQKLDAASTSIGAEIEKQKKINAAAKEKFDNMDMMEKAQRMQAFMMKNPQAAAKMMQAEQAAGAAVSDAAFNESSKRLEAELSRHQASMRGALELAVKPIKARQELLIKSKTVAVGEAAEPMFTVAADHAQYLQLIAEENAAAEKVCTAYFGANGTFHKWLASYRTDVIDKTASVADGTDIMLAQMAAMDLPGGGYKSTGPMEQVVTYLGKVRSVYDARPKRVRATVELKK